jgi:hypothetical protein
MKEKLGGFLWIVVAVIFLMAIGHSQHIPGTPDKVHTDNGMTLPDTHEGTGGDITWKVMRHNGFNPDWKCWILVLDREWENGGESGDFCAKDKADYDAHPDGTMYTTHGGWLDNLMHGADTDQPKTDTA